MSLVWRLLKMLVVHRLLRVHDELERRLYRRRQIHDAHEIQFVRSSMPPVAAFNAAAPYPGALTTVAYFPDFGTALNPLTNERGEVVQYREIPEVANPSVGSTPTRGSFPEDFYRGVGGQIGRAHV